MINSIYATEKKYIKCFCEAEIFNGYMRLKDDHIKDMYSHNFTYINHDITEETFISIIISELAHRARQNKKFLKIVTSLPIDSKLLNQLPLKPDFEVYDYWGKSIQNNNDIKEKKNTFVRLVNNPVVNEDGRLVDIIANYSQMTLEFAIRRIDRKFQIYANDKMPINLYVCYSGIEPVGNCELMINENIAKIEDFDIIQMYQRKGFGSHMIKNLLHICHKHHVENAYLMTDSNDSAKDMYAKCGFRQIGQRYELMFHLSS